jgi:TonB family protein
MFGRGGLAGGLEKNLGAMTGRDLADQNGTHGLGLRGDKRGGGGHSLTIGFADHGHGHGPLPSGPSPKKKDANVRVDSEETQVVQMDPALIDAAIRRHLPEIEYCYDRELQSDPSLAGKVVVHFVITGDGHVGAAEIEQSTLGNAAVDGCVLTRVKAIVFAQPPGRGMVSVHYPFLFKGAGR